MIKSFVEIGEDDVNGTKSMAEYIELILEFLIGTEKYLNYLNERSLAHELHQQRIINLLKNNNHDWRFLLRNLKPMKEEHDGMRSYLSTLTKRLTELETSKENTTKDIL